MPALASWPVETAAVLRIGASVTLTLLVSMRSVPVSVTVAVTLRTVEAGTVVPSAGAVMVTVTSPVGVTTPVPPAPALPVVGRNG